jgi:hypothetical protein
MRQEMLQRKTVGGSFLSAVRTVVVFCFTVAVQAFVVTHGFLIFYGFALKQLFAAKLLKIFIQSFKHWLIKVIYPFLFP